MSRFVPGLELSRRFYRDEIRPVIKESFPRLRYAAALMGPGSEVLGYDDPTSTDHHWGPRLLVFLEERDAGLTETVKRALGLELPAEYAGYSTHFGPPDGAGVRLMEPWHGGPVAHMVEVHTLDSWLSGKLGFDPRRKVAPGAWLGLSQQTLLELTAGEVFHDGLGRLRRLRKGLAWFPRDVWLHHLALAWQELADEMAFVGRCGERGDELGSRLIGARQVERIMGLCFLLERTYRPYAKWTGKAFCSLKAAPRLKPILERSLRSEDWIERQEYLAKAYEAVARKHNRLELTPPQPARVEFSFDRPYLVIRADRFALATRRAIRDREIRSLSRPEAP